MRRPEIPTRDNKVLKKRKTGEEEGGRGEGGEGWGEKTKKGGGGGARRRRKAEDRGRGDPETGQRGESEELSKYTRALSMAADKGPLRSFPSPLWCINVGVWWPT